MKTIELKLMGFDVEEDVIWGNPAPIAISWTA
jgi:hypothetical protein